MNQGTRITSEAQTNANGYFLFLNVQPGPYVLTIEKQGFKTAQVSVFDILVNQTLTQSIRLDLGQVNESIAVNAEAPLLQSSTSELGTVISETPLKEFYLDGILSTDIRGAFYGVLPILDTLNEFKVQSQNDNAEFCGTLGGRGKRSDQARHE